MKSNLRWSEADYLDATERIAKNKQSPVSRAHLKPQAMQYVQKPVKVAVMTQEVGKTAKQGIKGRVSHRKRHITGVCNATEQKFIDQWITPRLQTGEIVDYWFEAVTLRLADALRYTPDFFVQDKDGYLSFYEVKGTTRNKQGKQIAYAYDDAKAKVAVSPFHFPFNFYIAFCTKQGWEIIQK